MVVPLVPELFCSILLNPENVMHRTLPMLAIFRNLEDAIYWNDPKGILARLDRKEQFLEMLSGITLSRFIVLEKL